MKGPLERIGSALTERLAFFFFVVTLPNVSFLRFTSLSYPVSEFDFPEYLRLKPIAEVALRNVQFSTLVGNLGKHQRPNLLAVLMRARA